LDISSVDSIAQAIEDNQPDVIINTAAYTAVDKAESEPANAWRVNADGAEKLARQCTAASIQLIHISTDYGFDGNASSAYSLSPAATLLGNMAEASWLVKKQCRPFVLGRQYSEVVGYTRSMDIIL
jgi:dTDP-4-dehydrorhamnose reductase